ncbi:MAG: hypothetical protein WBW67_03860, partial [Pseudolabrys sp.]
RTRDRPLSVETFREHIAAEAHEPGNATAAFVDDRWRFGLFAAEHTSGEALTNGKSSRAPVSERNVLFCHIS